MIKNVRSYMNDNKGYGAVELMVIIAALGALAVAIFTNLNNGLPNAADDVSTSITNKIGEWDN